MSNTEKQDQTPTTIESYFRTYTRLAELTRKETYAKYPNEADTLFEFIDNWPDFAKLINERLAEISNSLSGIILVNSWRLTNWISFDILSGKYFEAIRNLRFIFEGSVYAILVEEAIEDRVFQRWETFSELGLKAEIFELWEECKRKHVCRKGQVNVEKVRRIVTAFIAAKIDSTRKGRENEYVQIYTEILCDARLYLSTSRMLEACAAFLRLDESDTKNLRHLWHTLSGYQHFSYPYLQTVLDDPESCLMEKLNDDLLQRSSVFYFDTLDFFYAVLAWRFGFLRKAIKEICSWWYENFKKNLGVAEKALARLEPE